MRGVSKMPVILRISGYAEIITLPILDYCSLMCQTPAKGVSLKGPGTSQKDKIYT